MGFSLQENVSLGKVMTLPKPTKWGDVRKTFKVLIPGPLNEYERGIRNTGGWDGYYTAKVKLHTQIRSIGIHCDDNDDLPQELQSDAVEILQILGLLETNSTKVSESAAVTSGTGEFKQQTEELMQLV